MIQEYVEMIHSIIDPTTLYGAFSKLIQILLILLFLNDPLPLEWFAPVE